MKIKTQTFVRTACLALALLNNVLTMMGKNPLPFSEDEAYCGLSALVTVAVSLWTWWENNSFTKAALSADAEYERIKAEEKSEKEESER